MKTNKLRLWGVIVLATLQLLLVGCGGSESDLGDGGITGTGLSGDYTIEGAAQKGPFLTGSTVDVTQLSDKGTALDSSLTTSTTDSLGSFEFKMTEGPILITVSGYHFNELTGKLSNGILTLRAVSAVQKKGKFGDELAQISNVNILTHIIHSRVLRLMSTGSSVSNALEQAQDELIRELTPLASIEGLGSFSELSIYNSLEQDNTGNDYLLFISAAFYQYSTLLANDEGVSVDAKLSQILNMTAEDFGDDGLINQLELIQQLRISALDIDPITIRTNLENRSRDIIGEILPVADIRNLLAQLIVTYPSDNATVSKPIQIRFRGLDGFRDISYNLFVDGKLVKTGLTDDVSFNWAPYFWSGDTNSHTLLVEADTGDKKVLSNLVNVFINNSEAAQLLKPISPANGQIIRDTTIATLKWESLSDAVSYNIQLFEDNDNVTPLYEFTTTKTEMILYGLNKGSYAWKIRATDANDLTGVWSPLTEFSINGLRPPASETMSSQIGDFADGQYSADITWASVIGASYYEIEVSRDIEFTKVSFQTSVIGNSTSFSLPPGDYYWRVKSYGDTTLPGDWSEAKSLDLGVYTYTFNNGYKNSAIDMVTTDNDGVILLIHSFSGKEPLGDDRLIKLDAKGSVQWTYLLQREGAAQLKEIMESDEGFLYGIGYIDEATGSYSYILKIDTSNNTEDRIVWERKLSVNENTTRKLDNITEVNKKLYIVGRDETCLIKDNEEQCNQSNKIFEIDTNDGDILSEKPLLQPWGEDFMVATYIASTSQGDLLIGCNIYDEAASKFAGFTLSMAGILKVSPQGELDWSYQFPNSTYASRYVAEMPNGGYVLVAQTFGGGASIAYFDEDGALDKQRNASVGFVNFGESAFHVDNDLLLISSDETLWSVSESGTKTTLKKFDDRLEPVAIAKSTDGTHLIMFNEYLGSGSGDSNVIVKKLQLN